MEIDVSFVKKCIDTLERAHRGYLKQKDGSLDYELYRSACVKEFEIILEQSGKLLRKVLKPYSHSSKDIDRMYFKDLFRRAVKHSLITADESERWLQYRNNRNETAHDYGKGFAENTLKLIPGFIADARRLMHAIKSENSQT